MKNYIKYESIKNGYITKEQAIAIACCDRNLKDSIFKKWKKEDNLLLGFISFNTLNVALVKVNSDFGWHIKVKSGTWGAVKLKKIPVIGIRYGYENWDGEIDESCDISCVIMCNIGEYYFGDDIDLKKLEAPDMNEYNNYINTGSIYHM